jgi:glycosyltransferase involved in cell wall biosynthesis
MPVVLFLYTELAEYTLACMRELAASGVQVHTVHFPVNKEAPFVFQQTAGLTLYDRRSFSRKALEQAVERLGPSAIVCSGWIDKEYVAVCKKFSHVSTTILAFDNKWQGTLKQHLASWVGRFTIANHFDFAWVPGAQQAVFAHKLGFTEERIAKGFYSCDHKKFSGIYERTKNNEVVPERFIYAGRYYGFKGVTELWEAFTELKSEYPNAWELWCMGAGDLRPVEHPAIKHFGFVQPGEMEGYMRATGVFVMPSRIEPWGVALHEFTAAGFPVICSSAVGAAEAFLREGKNGFLFEAGNKQALKDAMRKMVASDKKKLQEMSRESVKLAGVITPASWSQTLLKLISE